MSQHSVVLLLGSNLGNAKLNIDQALFFLQEEIGEIKQKSEHLSSSAVEFESCNIFCNIALRIFTDLSPFKLLQKLKQYEKKMGRQIDSADLGKYSDRIIDIDIVLFDNLTFKSKKLTIPHDKNLNERDFSKKLIAQLVDN
ncbi:2-amino-4-hydroxy-6-hydroxymethyldihydropteridine diphosphokinase [Halpernia frigidisoli]|uniref:2-amino-4-hydroxy-6-hydroxymethyldihydropteridine pyrophosphokinase n=1 Tax=Halpernia frigidisoli TaxID=1125876 RepID=A0A1I3FU82_9FLAO|nr:2-amino-4-hydroxy-6-hydroxymethyldihydropteridine diphosphokinase [Halpernia frigidisoli]SFI14491.1 2-amino-4-hydroxy-6-hydroxymethyldihydropteridinediphosphokinase [Halpernia frigidisoli]